MKSSKVNIIIIVICFVLTVGICIFLIVNHKGKVVTDALKFKEEYEAYNDYVNPNTDEKFLSVIIDENNPIIYKTAKEIVEILKNEDALILFGYPSSSENRMVIEALLEATSEAKVGKLYYLDILNIRDEYADSGNILPTQTKKGTDAYLEIVDFLDEYLEMYYIRGEDNNLYGTTVKRVNAPTFVATSKGEVIGFHEGVLSNSSKELSEEEKEELKNIYLEIINNWLNKTTICSSNSAC